MSGKYARNVAGWAWVLALVVAGAVASCTSSNAPGGGCSADLNTDVFNCGGCGITCNAGASCVAGVCTCPAPYDKVCSGQCVQSQVDPYNCGTCGHLCGIGTCSTGACVCDTTTTPTVQLCPNNPQTGTCVDIATNFYNCGACGAACYTGATCSGSACQCASPKQYCGSGSATVCTDTSSDPKNCGACGTVCAVGQTCSGGTCQLTCPTGLTLCGSSCVDTNTDSANCGRCGIACGTGKSCVGGTCQASCTTLQCGGTCCSAPAGNACCGSSCPYQHKNFVGQADEQTYYDCTSPTPYSVTTALKAAAIWTPAADGGTLINSAQGCPTTAGSLCVVWRRNALIGTNAACAVFCYEGPYAGAATRNPGSVCACPTTQQVDWY